jgi:hypothetical protein
MRWVWKVTVILVAVGIACGVLGLAVNGLRWLTGV